MLIVKRGSINKVLAHDQIFWYILLFVVRTRWSVIARHLPKRTDNEVKNYWNTHLKKRLIDQGIDPLTHKPLASNPNPATPRTSEGQDDSNPINLDEQSQSGSMSPKSLPHSSSSCNLQTIINSDETPRNNGSLSSKKCRFKKLSSTSKLLNKVATKASSIGNMLSASMEGSLIRSTTLSPCLNDVFSETSQFLRWTSLIHSLTPLNNI